MLSVKGDTWLNDIRKQHLETGHFGMTCSQSHKCSQIVNHLANFTVATTLEL